MTFTPGFQWKLKSCEYADGRQEHQLYSCYCGRDEDKRMWQYLRSFPSKDEAVSYVRSQTVVKVEEEVL